MSSAEPVSSAPAAASDWLIRLNRADLITLASVPLCGIALMCALQQQLFSALGWLFLAMTADAMDGVYARRWGLTREFGRYLDGFMDVLIYLAMPALILVQWGMTGWWAWVLIPFVMAGCIRLAVFNQSGNIQRGSQLAYAGMPVFWSLLLITPLLLLQAILPATFKPLFQLVLCLVLLVFSVLMVRARPFFKFTSVRQMLSITLGGFILTTLMAAYVHEEMTLSSALLAALYLQVPVVIGGVAHMWCVSHNLLPALVRPLHSGYFGANKTWRGLILVPLLTAAGALLLSPVEWLLAAIGVTTPLAGYSLLATGLVAGLGYVVGELPNSFYKRRLGIAAGEVPEQRKYWFIALDQVDSAVGVALAYMLWLPLNSPVLVFYVLTFPLVALLVKQWLYSKQLKNSAT